MYDIFLSYATSDRDRLNPLVDALEERGWTVFWDHRSIKVAQEWHDVVSTAIQQSTCVVVAWSEASVESIWVKEEALIARDRGVLYPIMIDEVPIPFGFNMIQAADFTDWNEDKDHQEFIELREQLAIRLSTLSRPSASEQPLEKPVAQSLMPNPQTPVTLEGSAISFKIPGIIAILAFVGFSGYQYFNPEHHDVEEQEPQETVVTPPLLANMDGVPAGKAISSDSNPKEVIKQESEALAPTITEEQVTNQPEEIHVPEMVKIRGGVFLMGCAPGRDDIEKPCLDNQQPAHEVKIKPFLLAKTEVTIAHFRAFVNATHYKTTAETQGSCWSYDADEKWNNIASNSWRRPGFKQAGNQPVTCISWHDTQAYAEWLRLKTGKPWRLPTEAEWEYAARANTHTAYSWGFRIDKNKANCWKKQCGEAFKYTSPAGSFAEIRLACMICTVMFGKWVEDHWQDNYHEALEDGTAQMATASHHRVLRGGSWRYAPEYLRSANRIHYAPETRSSSIGFRLAQDYTQ